MSKEAWNKLGTVAFAVSSIILFATCFAFPSKCCIPLLIAAGCFYLVGVLCMTNGAPTTN